MPCHTFGAQWLLFYLITVDLLESAIEASGIVQCHNWRQDNITLSAASTSSQRHSVTGVLAITVTLYNQTASSVLFLHVFTSSIDVLLSKQASKHLMNRRQSD